MRRIVCALAPLIVVLISSTTAQAWVPVASYDVPGGGLATCLRDAGSGQVTLLGAFSATATPIDVLQVQGATFSVVGSTTLGRLVVCPGVGAGGQIPMAGDVYLGRHGDGVRTAERGATLDGPPVEIADTSNVPTFTASVATNGAGATVVAWPQLEQALSADTDPALTIRVAVRPAGATAFLPAQTLATNGSLFVGNVEVGVDDGGRATIAWVTNEGLPGGRVNVVTADAGGQMGAPQVLDGADTDAVSMAESPDGRALLVTRTTGAFHVFERLPGAEQFAPVSPPPNDPARAGIEAIDSSGAVSVALDPVGNAVIASSDGVGTDVRASVRAAGDTFAPWTTLQTPPKPEDDELITGAYGAGGESLELGGGGFEPEKAQPPEDDDHPALSTAIGRDGSVAVAWTTQSERGLRTAHAASGSIAHGVGRGSRISTLCAPARDAQAIVLADGSVAVAWTDTVRTTSALGDKKEIGGGRLHLSRPGTAPAATAPRPSVAVVDHGPLRIGDPLRLRASCAGGPCDLRVSAPVRVIQSPWSKPRQIPGLTKAEQEILERNRRIQLQDAPSTDTRSLPAGQVAAITLPGTRPVSYARPRARSRTLVTAVACSPDGSASRRVTLRPLLQGAPYRPLARIVSASATRHGRTITVTVRLDRPLHGFASALVLPFSLREPGTATVPGRGRRVVQLVVPVTTKNPVRALEVQVLTADYLEGPPTRITVR